MATLLLPALRRSSILVWTMRHQLRKLLDGHRIYPDYGLLWIGRRHMYNLLLGVIFILSIYQNLWLTELLLSWTIIIPEHVVIFWQFLVGLRIFVIKSTQWKVLMQDDASFWHLLLFFGEDGVLLEDVIIAFCLNDFVNEVTKAFIDNILLSFDIDWIVPENGWIWILQDKFNIYLRLYMLWYLDILQQLWKLIKCCWYLLDLNTFWLFMLQEPILRRILARVAFMFTNLWLLLDLLYLSEYDEDDFDYFGVMVQIICTHWSVYDFSEVLLWIILGFLFYELFYHIISYHVYLIGLLVFIVQTI